MDIFTRGLWIITAIGFTISIIKDKEKTFRSMKMARGMMKNMMGQIIGILFLIGLILTFIPPEIINSILEVPMFLQHQYYRHLSGALPLFLLLWPSPGRVAGRHGG